MLFLSALKGQAEDLEREVLVRAGGREPGALRKPDTAELFCSRAAGSTDSCPNQPMGEGPLILGN